MGEMQVDGKPGTLAVPGYLDGVYAAGNGKRILAKILDGVIGGAAYLVTNYIGLAMLYQGSAAGLTVMFVVPILYLVLVLVLVLKSGQTPGGKLAGLRMVRFDNGRQAGGAAFGKLLLESVISFVSLGIAPLIMWFTTQDEANRHWFDRTCGVLTIDLRQGRDSADQDSFEGFVPKNRSGLQAMIAENATKGNGESLPPLPPKPPVSSVSQVPPLPSVPPLPAAAVPPPSSAPPFAAAAVSAEPFSPEPLSPLSSDYMPPRPPLPPTPPLPQETVAPASGFLPSPDGFIDEVPWRRSSSAASQPAPTSLPESGNVLLGGIAESDIDKTVVSPKNKPVTLVFDDGTSYVLEQDAVVGRDPQCDTAHQGAIRLQVDDPSMSVSKTHMALALKAGALLVEDLYSTNGTQVTNLEGQTSNVLPGSPMIVARGTLIQFGDRSVRVSE